MHHQDHMRHKDNSNIDNHELGQGDYLSGAQIVPRRVHADMTAAELIDQQFQAYPSARLNEAARLYATEMLDPAKEATMGLTIAGAMTTARLRGGVITLLDN